MSWRFWNRRPDDDFRDEIQSHIELEAERLVAQRGMSAEDARFAARRRFGNVTRAQEQYHDLDPRASRLTSRSGESSARGLGRCVHRRDISRVLRNSTYVCSVGALDSRADSSYNARPTSQHSFKVLHMMRHPYVFRALLRQTGWLPFAGSVDASSGRGAVEDWLGRDRT